MEGWACLGETTVGLDAAAHALVPVDYLSKSVHNNHHTIRLLKCWKSACGSQGMKESSRE